MDRDRAAAAKDDWIKEDNSIWHDKVEKAFMDKGWWTGLEARGCIYKDVIAAEKKKIQLFSLWMMKYAGELTVLWKWPGKQKKNAVADFMTTCGQKQSLTTHIYLFFKAIWQLSSSYCETVTEQCYHSLVLPSVDVYQTFLSSSFFFVGHNQFRRERSNSLAAKCSAIFTT